MKRTAWLLAVAILVTSACGDDGAAALDDCDAVADATIDLVQDVIDEFEAMTATEAADVMSGAMTPAFEAIAARGDEIGTAAETLACTDIDAMVAERADQLAEQADHGAHPEPRLQGDGT